MKCDQCTLYKTCFVVPHTKVIKLMYRYQVYCHCMLIKVISEAWRGLCGVVCSVCSSCNNFWTFEGMC